ncbi:MAG: aminodeoxychorismate/anthranilate synthase component II [Euzebyales bacterium]|jgi:anthranilate synthase/aminodeoxychorismate synthase-like glutamine amidotransferase|nr:aminodeoxychorismate/anthranilate synthase component II [Euzebyales bacterium]
MARVFLVDNYDSFTYNLAQELGELGAEVEVARHDAFSLDELAAWDADGIVISPGPGTPADAGLSSDVIRRFAGRVPLLGVCLGHQCIAEVYGGTIVRAPELVHGKTSAIHHDGLGVFDGLPQPFTATRYHSLVADAAKVPAELDVTARTGNGLIMGLRHREQPVEGVQFHPESILTTVGMDLLGNFLSSLAQPAPA